MNPDDELGWRDGDGECEAEFDSAHRVVQRQLPAVQS
jgi:hypothetical protein